MTSETDGASRRDVDENGRISSAIESDTKVVGNLGKGQNIGEGRRIEPDGKGNKEHTKDTLLRGADSSATVGIHDEGVSGAVGDVGEKAGVLEERVRGAAVHEDAVRWESTDGGGKVGAAVGALGGVVALLAAGVAGDGGMKVAVGTGDGGGILCEGGLGVGVGRGVLRTWWIVGRRAGRRSGGRRWRVPLLLIESGEGVF